MIAVLITVRDILIAAALAWVGVTFDAPARHAPQQPASASTPACSGSQMCSAQRPHFDALGCDEK